MTTNEERQMISDIARNLVSELVPEELPLFRANSEAYFSDSGNALKSQSSKDNMLGFGPGDAVVYLTPAILEITRQVVAFVFEEVKKAAKGESAAWVNDAVKSMFALFRKDKPLAHLETHRAAVQLSAEQLAQVRRMVIDKATQLKFSEMRANTLADAVVGGLALA